MQLRTATKTKPAHASPNESAPKAGIENLGLTLAAMSLGYGVVQLDVTIVNTAMPAIGSSPRPTFPNSSGS